MSTNQTNISHDISSTIWLKTTVMCCLIKYSTVSTNSLIICCIIVEANYMHVFPLFYITVRADSYKRGIYQQGMRKLDCYTVLALWGVRHGLRLTGVAAQEAHNTMITLLWRRNDVATSFRRHNDVTIASFICRAVWLAYSNKYGLLICNEFWVGCNVLWAYVTDGNYYLFTKASDSP